MAAAGARETVRCHEILGTSWHKVENLTEYDLRFFKLLLKYVEILDP